MASLSKEKERGFRIQWRFVVRVGPRAGETVIGSLLLGHCTRAAAKAQLRETEVWEEAVNPAGTFELDMKKRLPLDAPVELLVQ